MTLTFDIESCVLYVTRLLLIINIFTKLYENATITFEVTARTRSNGRTHAQKLQNCGDYVSLTASGLDKNQTLTRITFLTQKQMSPPVQCLTITLLKLINKDSHNKASCRMVRSILQCFKEL